MKFRQSLHKWQPLCLKNVTISNNITKINDYIFDYCESLTNIGKRKKRTFDRQLFNLFF